MAMTMHVNIVSAEEEVYSGTAEFILARAAEGEVGILPRHMPMLAQLKPGEVMVRAQGGEEQFFYVSGGLMEVQPHVVTVLADAATRAKDLDEAAAQEAIKRAEEAMKNQDAKIEYATAQAQLAEAAAQLRTLQRVRKTLGR
ncbi:F0F1 ATP synthase subunit epsilon [Alkalilimnicola sp. S0819]|uniref:F0F1 ATP synthase subunit epsilon n=1 Tax=Alkalilimnicola sp. S0819 TaxID=2613922 RepID=UPI00126156B1|nr:F0F1 ATP synthase subunit epsilon [Alkalilimnicola sp. S0819]KAB7624213.1 F0F1 ATP synthase subunit epsilon [Alkalilimnicola sp. S0819]MPQ16468.1 F0F1 ATP synthase subunit epsilon [Alkalilimnicola sp. S0819]